MQLGGSVMASRRNRMKVRPEDILPISDEEPLKLFHASIRAEITDKDYTRRLRQILCDVLETVLEGTFEERVKEFVEIGKNDEERMLGILLGLSNVMAERTKKDRSDPYYMNPSSIPSYFVPLKKLLNSNDVTVRWNRVTQTYPELDNVDDSKGWTLKDIQCMLDHTKNAMERALILTLASSGVRISGMLLRWGDLTRMYSVGGRIVKEEDLEEGTPGKFECVAVRVYRNTYDEYTTFITPEAYRDLMEYAVQWETKVGRKPHDSDPIFKSHRKPQSMLSTHSINTAITRIASSAGVRRRQRDNPRKWEVPLLHGFRRFFNKAMKDTKTGETPLSTIMKSEFIIGHSGLAPLDRNYYKTDVEEKAETYVKAVPNLTIRESERLKYVNRCNNKVRSELNRPDKRIGQLEEGSTSEEDRILEEMLEYFRNGTFADSA